MHDQSIHTFEFPNGLVLLVEEMRHVQSASFAMMTPAGSLYEPAGRNGTAAILCDLMTRGAGSRGSRELSAVLDHLGVQRSESVGWSFLTFAGATLAENLVRAIPVYADILRRPTLPEDQFPAVVSGVEQSLLAEEDEPQRKALIELRRYCYDSPWNRPSDGTLGELDWITHADAVQHARQNLRPNGTLIGVAGNVDAHEVRDVIDQHFGDWPAGEEPELERVVSPVSQHHIDHDSAQTHIALAYPSVPYGHPDYYAAWAAIGILSGGSSSRLFTEVREKRGLCYSVYASLNSLLTEGRVMAYAGTTTERAQETFDVMLHEIKRIGEDIDDAELARCKARAKSSLIMQQESTGARAASIARDWFHLKRINTLAEIHQIVDGLTVDQIVDYVNRNPVRDMTVLTIGAKPLQLP